MDRRCRKCSVSLDESNTYKSVKGYICRKCFNSALAERSRKNKKELVAYMGGKCQVCGYNKYDGALEFHHLDPRKKTPNFNYFRSWSRERQLRELENCVLVCANCHAEIEAGVTECPASSEEELRFPKPLVVGSNPT